MSKRPMTLAAAGLLTFALAATLGAQNREGGGAAAAGAAGSTCRRC